LFSEIRKKSRFFVSGDAERGGQKRALGAGGTGAGCWRSRGAGGNARQKKGGKFSVHVVRIGGEETTGMSVTHQRVLRGGGGRCLRENTKNKTGR